MSIGYNRLYSNTSEELVGNLQNIESTENEEPHSKSSDAVLKAREHLALQKIKYALSKLIGRKYAYGTITDNYELCLLQNYLSIVTQKMVLLENENPKLFEIIERLKSVIDVVDGDGTLDEKLLKINGEFPEFRSAFERIRVLIEDKQVLNEEETHEYKYPDFPRSNYVLTKKIKECIAERRKMNINILNVTGDTIDEESSQKERDNILNVNRGTLDEESSQKEGEKSLNSFIIDNEKEKECSVSFSEKDEQFHSLESTPKDQSLSRSRKGSDALIKYLLITGIKKNLGNNNENVERELMKLESTPEFKENLVFEIDDTDGERVKSLLDEIRNRIINFNESRDIRLYRKTPVQGIDEKCIEATRLQKLVETRSFRLLEAEMHDVIRKFQEKTFHTEEEIDELVNSKPYQLMIEKVAGKKGGKIFGKRRPIDSDVLRVIKKRLSEVKHDDAGKFELEELNNMEYEELVDLLSNFVASKQDYQDIASQNSSIQRSVKFHIDQKSLAPSKSTKTVQSAGWILEEKPSKVVSKDSFLDPGPYEERPAANSTDEMMSRLTMNDFRAMHDHFCKSDLISEKPAAPRTFLRPARYSDLSHLERLVNDRTLEMFGDKNLSYYFEYSNACIVQLSKDNKLVAFMAVQNDPSVPSLPPSSWDIWIHDLYGIDDCTYTNTMFVRMLLWDERYESHFLEPFLTYLYINTYMLKQVFLVKPPGVECPSCVEKAFMKINPRKSSSDQVLYQNFRYKHIPTLKIRKTAEQDNIDIMPELNRTAPELGRIFGDYLISELVRFSTKDRIGLTAFANEKIVGYALLNTNVCVTNLNKFFEVAAFNGFYLHHEKDQFPPGRTTKLIEDNYPNLPKRIDNLCFPDKMHETRRESSFTRSSPSFNVDSDMDFLPSSSSDEEVVMEEIEVPQSFIFSSDFAKRRPTQLIDKNDLSFQASDKLKINLNVSRGMTSGILTRHEFTRDFLHMQIEMSNPPPIIINRHVPIEPVYFGEPNVVMIEIFLMLRGVDYRLSYDFLEAIFEVINVDYCILSFPTSDPIPPIVDHFARLIPKSGTWFPHEVYVLHRSYILSSKTVRAANRNDFNNILMLTSKLVNYRKIRDDFIDSLFEENTSLESYVLLCCDVMVGLCIIDKTPLALANLEMQFDLDKYMGPSMYKNHGIIKHCCIHPIFSTCSTILFREVIRLSSVACLFYRLFEEDVVNSDLSAPTIISCIGDLVPVIPRQPLQYHSDLAKGNVVTTNIPSDPDVANSGFFCSMVDTEENKKSEKFALFFMNTKVGSMLKRCIHLKIVIVGASGTALSFIESLIFRTELEVVYTNIVLVAPNGLPCRQKPHAVRDAMGIYRGRYNRDFMTQLGMNAWINISYGYMTAIDRNKKFITINYDKKINYDYLFLFTGQQFMKPVFHTFKEKFEPNSSFFAGNEKFTYSYLTECPLNMFLLNSDVDASYSLMTIKKLLNCDKIPKEGMFVVYGHMLEAYAVLNALTKFGIPTSRIAFVEPFPNEPSETLFNDTAIDEAVLSTMESEGFAIYPRFYLTNWDFDSNENVIKKLYFQSIAKIVSIDCFCLYAFDFKSTDLRTFIALVNSQLVYDGKLVIDNQFRTNDQYIYAAGPLTRYSRSYYSEHMDHEYYNSIEIGMQVHKSVRHILDSRSGKDDFERRESDEFSSMSDVMGLHQLLRPRIESCQLPGGWNYLRVIKPGKVLPLENQLANKDMKGPKFITGNCTDKTGPGYFKLALDHNRIVIEIVCYTRQDIEIHNLIRLYGKHVALFNNLEQRYNLGTVHDLYDYFRQPWAYAMYHDKFYFVEKKNRRLFYNTKLPNESNKTFSDVINDALCKNEWADVSVNAIEDLRKLMYNNTKISGEIHGNLKSFLIANELNLPMYINDEYIIVNKDEATKHHLHNTPPLGVSPKSVKQFLALLEKIPEGVTMEEYQKRYFKTFEDKSVNTTEHGFCVTSYLSLHSGADKCDNCEEYRKLRNLTYYGDVDSEHFKSPQKSPTSREAVVKTEKYLDSAQTKTKSTDKIPSQALISSEIVGKVHGSNISLGGSVKKKSFSQTKIDMNLDDGTLSENPQMKSPSSQEASSKIDRNTSGSQLESSSEMDGKDSVPIEKSPLKLGEKSEVKTRSQTRVDRSRTSESVMKREPSLLKVESAGDDRIVTSSNMKIDSEMAGENLDASTEPQPKLKNSSRTEMNGEQSSSVNVSHTVDATHIENPISSESRLGSQKKMDGQTTQSAKYPSSNTSINKKLEVKDGSRNKLDASKTRVTPVSSSKTSDLNKGSRLSGELNSSETGQRLQTKSASDTKTESSYLKPGSVSSKLGELNKTLQNQLEHRDKFVELKKYDSISQSSFSPLLLDDLLDHVSKIQNLDMSSFEDVHNVRWKRFPTKSDVGTSMGTERDGNFSQKSDKSTSCKKDKEGVIKCSGKLMRQLKTKK